MAEDKGFKPTARKLEKARKQGQVLKSRLLTQAGCISAAISVGYIGAMFLWLRLKLVVNYCFSETLSHINDCLEMGAATVLWGVAAVLGGAVSAAIIAESLQVGLRLTVSSAACKAERLSVGAGAQRIGRGLRKAPANALKVLILGYLFCMVCMWRLPKIVRSLFGGPGERLEEFFGLLAASAFCVGLSLLVLGIVEYLAARRKFYRELSMSADELRREQKETQGDSFVKAWRRSLHEALVFQDLVKSVRTAKVVVACKSDPVK